jgi:hypothetical protein
MTETSAYVFTATKETTAQNTLVNVIQSATPATDQTLAIVILALKTQALTLTIAVLVTKIGTVLTVLSGLETVICDVTAVQVQSSVTVRTVWLMLTSMLTDSAFVMTTGPGTLVLSTWDTAIANVLDASAQTLLTVSSAFEMDIATTTVRASAMLTGAMKTAPSMVDSVIQSASMAASGLSTLTVLSVSIIAIALLQHTDAFVMSGGQATTVDSTTVNVTHFVWAVMVHQMESSQM